MYFNIILFSKIVLIKGTVSRVYLLVYFMDHLPQAPDFNIRVSFKFFQKLPEVFASQGAPQVSTAPVAIHISAYLTPCINDTGRKLSQMYQIADTLMWTWRKIVSFCELYYPKVFKQNI
jgi:hypothetical protein